MDNLENILEGLLFVAGDGIEKGYIMEKLGVTDKEITKAVDKLKNKYSGDCGINVITYKNKIQMSSNSKYADDISLVLNPIRERNLSKATLETVAIIAYKQPITRLEIEDIRGVNSDYALQTLMNLKMIEVVGRKDAVGKPLLFGTTDEFLKRFDLQDLNQLPDYDELLKSIQVIEQESNHLYSDYEIPDEEPTDETTPENTEENIQPSQELESKEQVETDEKVETKEKVENKEKVKGTKQDKKSTKENSDKGSFNNVKDDPKQDETEPKEDNDVTIESKEDNIVTTEPKEQAVEPKENDNISQENNNQENKDTIKEKEPIVVEDDTLIIDIDEPKVIDDDGDDFFASLDDEIPDFLKDEKDLQKI